MFQPKQLSVLLAAMLAIAAPTLSRAALPEPVAQLMQTAQIPDDALGVLVLRGDTVVLAHNANQPMQPASTIKVLTTMTGLDQLGPVFRGRTELRSSAALVNGVLQGDLYLRGGADADLTDDVLRHMLQALRTQGIKKIHGDIVFDRQLFQPARLDTGLAPFDDAPDAYYNVIPDALLLNTNLLAIDVRASAGKLSATLLPELEHVSIRTELALSNAPCARWEEGWKAPEVTRRGDQLSVVLHGAFPDNCAKATSLNLLDRQDYLERLVRTTWRQLGGGFSGTMREAAAPADSRVLAEHLARSLPEVIRDTNKRSDNTLARTIFLSLGSLEADAALGSHPLPPDPDGLTTAARAERVIRLWMQRQHIDDTGLVLENGSGLSRTERVTPAQLAGVLQAAQRSPWAPEFTASLPIAAIDGTLRKRLKDSPAAARARLKTGSLSGVAALAGYVPDSSGQSCIVVVILNSKQSANGVGRGILDAMVDWVARSMPVPALAPTPASASASVSTSAPASLPRQQ